MHNVIKFLGLSEVPEKLVSIMHLLVVFGYCNIAPSPRMSSLIQWGLEAREEPRGGFQAPGPLEQAHTQDTFMLYALEGDLLKLRVNIKRTN